MALSIVSAVTASVEGWRCHRQTGVVGGQGWDLISVALHCQSSPFVCAVSRLESRVTELLTCPNMSRPRQRERASHDPPSWKSRETGGGSRETMKQVLHTNTHTHTEGEDFGDVEQHAAIDRPGEIWGSLVEKAEG